MKIDKILNAEQYSLNSDLKKELMLPLVSDLHKHHFNNCEAYKDISKRIYGTELNEKFESITELPFLPVSVFKNRLLKSVAEEDVYKVLTSSGTTGQSVSKIVLDKEAAQLQSLALSKIITHVVGKTRMDMLIVDSKAIYKNKQSFSARGAGVLGLSVFGKKHTYILDENFELDVVVFEDFLKEHDGKEFLIFGFTFMVWLYLFKPELSRKYDLSKAILIHSGGWKKLNEIAVDNATFRNELNEKFGLKHIYNFYGMIEQIGAVFLENSQGFLHCPNFADVIIRNPIDFSVQPHGEPGLIQVISVLPKSYPGYSLLTEDIGVIMGEDDALNQWKGKYFKILGRAKKAELRGCSDTFK